MTSNVPNNEFDGYVSTDLAPDKSICQWCGGKSDVKYYIVNGGRFHSQDGLFCCPCGKTFTSNVESVSQKDRAMAEQTKASNHWISRPMHIAVLSEQRICNAYHFPEGNEDDIVTMEDYEIWVAGRYAQ